jgi:hypothetical protein
MTDGRPTLSTQVKLNIIKIERLVWWLKTVGLSITNNHKNQILMYESLDNINECGLCILERESILEQNGQGSLALLSHWLLLKVLEVKFLKILKVVGA